MGGDRGADAARRPRAHPAAVLLHGSGPGTHDGDVGPNKVFREMAWGPAARGVAVLRYDKRTTAHAARFRALGRAATIEEEHVDDAVSAVRLLRADPRVSRIYLLAGSQSTALAADMAGRAGGVEGLVLADVGARGPLDMIIDQTTYGDSLATARGDSAEAARAREYRRRALLLRDGGALDTLTLFGLPRAYWAAMAATRAISRTAEFVRAGGRLLVVRGDRDYLTTEEDIAAWEAALGGLPRTTFRRYPALNHLMQTGVGKMTPDEYDREMEVSPAYVADVAAWILRGGG